MTNPFKRSPKLELEYVEATIAMLEEIERGEWRDQPLVYKYVESIDGQKPAECSSRTRFLAAAEVKSFLSLVESRLTEARQRDSRVTSTPATKDAGAG